jgi:hypothetical protein
MAVNPVLQSGISGVQSGLKSLDRAAQDIAHLNVDDARARSGAGDDGVIRPATSGGRVDDAFDAIVELKLAKRQVQASARVIETADQVLGFLLDIRA